MKILQINTYYKKGSTGRIVSQLCDRQLENDIEPYVMYGRGEKTGEDNVYKINNKLGYYIHKYRTHIFGNHAFYSTVQTKKAIKIIDEIKPDIIHLHNIHGHYLNCRILFEYINKNNIPVVWTLHDCWSFTGHCAHFISINCDKWKTQCNKCELRYNYPRTILDRSKSSFYKKKKLFCSIENLQIITVSNWLKNLVSQSFFKGKNIDTIYNYVDRTVFNEKNENNIIRKKYKIQDKFVILGVATGWTKSKGFDDFLDLSKLLGENEIIFIVGKSPVKELPKNIININATYDIEELVSIYQMADVFFNPSKEETFGLTTIEAMSCGTPAIVYNVTACCEIIKNENCGGIYVEAGNIKKAYEGMHKIQKDYKTFRDNAIKYVDLNFNKNQQLDKYINLYKKIYNKKSKPNDI